VVESMKNIIEFPSTEVAYEQAALWLVQMDDGGLSEEEVTEFRAWLGASATHVEAFRNTLATWEGVTTLQSLSTYFPLESLEARNRPAHTAHRAHRWPASIAAGLVVIALAIAAYVIPNAGIYRTGIGEHVRVELPDGSEMILNTNSELKVSFDEHVRRIDLLRGEAFFNVIKDPQRPFVVVGDDNVVTAVGTAFSVFKQNGTVKVLVSEGIVQLQSTASKMKSGADTDEPSGSKSPVYLERGQMGVFSETRLEVEAISTEKVEQQLSWRQSMLVFDGESLSQVMAEFQRYTQTRLIVDDSIADLRVGGYFRSDDIEGMLTSLQSNFKVAVVRLDGDRVLLQNPK
jgi:transmembrane sensor